MPIFKAEWTSTLPLRLFLAFHRTNQQKKYLNLHNGFTPLAGVGSRKEIGMGCSYGNQDEKG